MNYFFKQSKIMMRLVSCFLLFSASHLSQAADFSEDQVKAVYLFNFAGFIRWPDSAFVDTPEKFYFCAFSEKNKVVTLLKKVILKETVKGRKLMFQLVSHQEELDNCHVLFVSSSESLKTAEFSGEIQRNMLTVSDADDFATQGGMIAFSRTSKRLRSVINVKNLELAGLKASSKLLRLAVLVGDK